MRAVVENSKPSSRRSSAPRVGMRQIAAQETRDSILRAATKVFARHGYDGGRIEQISKAARSYDRMIYYYFESKEGLFIAVLEDMYRRFNEAESALALDIEQPCVALQAIVRFMWSYYQKHPEFITLLNAENLHRGKHIAKSMRAREFSSPAVAVLGSVLEAGREQKVFRSDIAARDVYLLIAAMGYFYQSNRYTLSAFLGEDLQSAGALAHWEVFLIETVMRTVSTGSLSLRERVGERAHDQGVSAAPPSQPPPGGGRSRSRKGSNHG